jgi:hypothetical protein
LNFREDDDGKYRAVSGDAWVLAVEFAPTPRAYSVLLYGNSNQPDSPYFYDQAEMFADNRTKPVAFTEEDIERQLIERYRPGEGEQTFGGTVARVVVPSEDHALVQQAGLRWLVKQAEQHPSGPLKTVCFVVPDLEDDLGPAAAPLPAFDRESLIEFMDEAFGLRARPRSGCELRDAPWRTRDISLYFDVETGEPAAYFVMSNPAFPEPSNAEIDLSFLVGDDWGEDHRCTLDRGEEGWAIAGCTQTGWY